MESKIEKRLRQGVEALGGKCLKFNSDSSDALPDRIIMIPAEDIIHEPITELVELKDGDEPRPKQKIRIAQFQKMGYRVTVIRSETDVVNYLEGLQQRIYEQYGSNFK